MEPIFTNDTVRTEAIDREFYANAKNPRDISISILILSAVAAYGIYQLVQGFGGDSLGFWMAGICLFVLVGMLAARYVQNRRLAKTERKKLAKRFGTADLAHTVEFFDYEYRFYCETTGADVTVRYSDISKIIRTSGCVLLQRRNGVVTILDGNGFSCTLEEALDFLRTHCPDARWKDRRKKEASA